MNRAMKTPSRSIWDSLAICGAMIVSISLSFAMHANAGDHAFVGESQCEDCHGPKEAAKNFMGPSGSAVNPVAVWQQDPHHKAFDALSNDWGKKAAAKANVSDAAAEGSMCLKCHATGTGSEGAPDPSEGVSCEACHGAAADWVKKSVHGEITDDAPKMQVATAAGLLDVRKMDIREKNCRGCHVTDRPCLKPGEKAFDVKNDSKFRHWRNNIPVI
jgi:Cytochrome c554 and c-prime